MFNKQNVERPIFHLNITKGCTYWSNHKISISFLCIVFCVFFINYHISEKIYYLFLPDWLFSTAVTFILWQKTGFHSLHGWVVVRSVNTLHFVYFVIRWCTSRLIPYLSHLDTNDSFICFHLLWVNLREE